MSTEKALILLPDGKKRLDEVIGYIKSLLKNESVTDYKIWQELFYLDPTEVLIYLETKSFGASPRFYWLFKSLIDSIDNFSSEALPNGKIQFIFGMKNIMTKMK